MAVWRDGISYTVEVAFASDPLATSPTWTDISAYVRQVPAMFRGTTSEFGQIGPGSCAVVLDNQDRRFDPDHATGPYYGNLLPNKRLRVTWAYSASSGTMFTGYVQGWPQSEIGQSVLECTVTAIDGFHLLSRRPLPRSAFAGTVIADGATSYWSLQNPDSLYGDIPGDSTHIQLMADYSDILFATEFVAGLGFPVADDSAMTTPRTYEATNLAVLTGTADPGQVDSLECWVRIDPLVFRDELNDNVPADPSFTIEAWSSADDIRMTLAVNRVNDDPYWELQYDDYPGTLSCLTSNEYGAAVLEDGLPHHVAVRVNSTTSVDVYVDGQLQFAEPLAASSSGPWTDYLYVAVSEGVDLSHVAFYSTALSEAQIQNHFDAGVTAFGHPYKESSGTRIDRALDDVSWPAALRDVKTGITPQSEYNPAGQDCLSYLQQVTRSEQGLLAIAGDGTLMFLDRDWFWNDAASGVVFTDDGNAGDLVYMDYGRDGNSLDSVRNQVSVAWKSGGVVVTDETVSRQGGGTYGGGAVVRKDATSIADYGVAEEFVDSPTIPDPVIAGMLGDYLIRQKKDPRTVISRVQVPVRINGGTNQVAKLFGLELGDVVTVERTPIGVGSQVAKSVQVLGIGHTVTNAQWLVDLYLSPAVVSATDAPYLTLGTAAGDFAKIGTAVTNIIPF